MQQTSPMIGSKDALTGRYGSISNSGLGSERPVYNKAWEDEEELDIDLDVDVEDDIRKKIRSVISPYDISSIGLEPQRRDMNSFASPQLIGEKTHTTTARSTISPFSHKQLYPNGTGPIIGTGGSNQAFRTTGNFKHIGSESGYVDPGTVMFSDDDEPLYDIRDILDPMERSFRKHQKSIKNVLNKINECLSDN